MKAGTNSEQTVVEACKHKIGAVGLWNSIRKVVQLAIENDDDIILICEDDHVFTTDYSKDGFLALVFEAYARQTEILLGGIGGFGSPIMVSEKLFWMDFFWCTQFTILFKSLFHRILDEPFTDSVTADGMLSDITSHKMVIYPYISTQKYLGDSDINAVNSQPGRLARLFETAAGKLEKIKAISRTFPPVY